MRRYLCDVDSDIGIMGYSSRDLPDKVASAHLSTLGKSPLNSRIARPSHKHSAILVDAEPHQSNVTKTPSLSTS